MRAISLIIAAAALTVGYTVPASAQVRSYASCEALAEQRDSALGHRAHREFIRECLAGKIPMSAAAQTPTVTHVLDAESFGYCQGLAEERGATIGYRVSREFMRECMDGKIPPR
jgi:hypothetical protein